MTRVAKPIEGETFQDTPQAKHIVILSYLTLVASAQQNIAHNQYVHPLVTPKNKNIGPLTWGQIWVSFHFPRSGKSYNIFSSFLEKASLFFKSRLEDLMMHFTCKPVYFSRCLLINQHIEEKNIPLDFTRDVKSQVLRSVSNHQDGLMTL